MTTDLRSCDFPAAHSMDTTWFAVDRDGHVGIFESGEPGAVPEVITKQVGQTDSLEGELGFLPVSGEPTFDASAVLHPGLRQGAMPRRWKVPISWPSAGDVCVLLFRDDSTLTPEVRALPDLRIASTGNLVVVSLESTEQLAKDDPRARAWTAFMLDAYRGDALVTAARLGGAELALARRGIFAYRAHDDRFNLPEPYGRIFTPSAPVRVDDLPALAREQLGARPRLGVSFAESAYVQPAELVPCATWESAIYLASDGFTVRPIPGREAEYERDASCIEQDDDSSFEPVVFDPPLDE